MRKANHRRMRRQTLVGGRSNRPGWLPIQKEIVSTLCDDGRLSLDHTGPWQPPRARGRIVYSGQYGHAASI